MIIEAKIISQPDSGDYTERVYDYESVWNSQSWTFIKFVNDDYSKWCGQFRGFPKQVAISTTRDIVLVLTSDYLFQLDSKTGNVTEIEDRPQYQNLTVAPNGDFILADFYNFEKVTTSIKNKVSIDSPIEMDTIEFKKWNNSRLEFTCNCSLP
jgi:hypothetical protein